ncbi:MAG: UDP-N-acetylmuramate--L-alanine ligase [Firmicutes bacterium]|nr:UDP-N-acetylmuramate--L-alanine ligase [Bacillota bacterium]
MVQHIHMIGIGGVGMSAIATVLLQMGYKVSGSDLKDSDVVRSLQRAGAEVYVGHAAAHVAGADMVVFSSAIPGHNPEIQEAKRLDIAILHRSEMLARIINSHDGIAVAGAHGKTTITGMIAHILSSLGLDPTVLAGGEMQNQCVHACWGRGRYVVAEADESDGSFLRYYPLIAIVTSVEADHLENYGGRAGQLVASYGDFLANIKDGGMLIISHQAYAALKDCIEQAQDRFSVVTYGIGQESRGMPEAIPQPRADLSRDYRAEDIYLAGSASSFSVYCSDKLLGKARLVVPGAYNVENALAAIAVAQEVGLEFDRIVDVLDDFHGAHRRFEWIGAGDGVVVYDDYAHHPTELKKTLQAAREFGRRVVAIFQPQRYSRTQLLMEEFGRSFGDADLVVITDIYAPPPEKPLPGVTAELLAELVGEEIGPEKVLYIGDKSNIPDSLLPHLQQNDLVITMGAGDIWQTAHALVKRLPQKDARSM